MLCPPSWRWKWDPLRDMRPIKFRWNYYRSMWAYALLCSSIGAFSIYAHEDLPFVDCLFLAVSAFTGSGLSPVAMSSLSSGSFAIIFALLLLGGTVFVLCLPIIFRIQSFRRLEPAIETVLSSVQHLIENPRIQNLLGLVSSRRAQVRGLGVLLGVIVIYLVLWIVCGCFIFWAILSVHDRLPEIESRGFSNAWVAAFTVVSAFCNGGFTLTSDSVQGWRSAPVIYLFLCAQVLAGNNAAPILLRGLLQMVHRYGRRLGLDQDGALFALDHPRQMTTHLFDRRQTRILMKLLLCLNVGQYAILLVATLPRSEHGNSLQVLGTGVFQTVSTRNAGFEIFELEGLNQGLLVLYMIMMYLSIAPFVSRMYISEETFDDFGQIGSWKKTTESSEAAMNRFRALFLFRHLSWLLVVFMVIAFVEDKQGTSNARSIPLFSMLFEIVSAYGNVGLSLGSATNASSLSAAFSATSKLLIISVMLLGKHRGLPAVSDITLNFQYTRLRDALQTAQAERRRRSSMRRPMRRPSLLDWRTARRGSLKAEEFEAHELDIVRKQLGLEDDMDFRGEAAVPSDKAREVRTLFSQRNDEDQQSNDFDVVDGQSEKLKVESLASRTGASLGEQAFKSDPVPLPAPPQLDAADDPPQDVCEADFVSTGSDWTDKPPPDSATKPPEPPEAEAVSPAPVPIDSGGRPPSNQRLRRQRAMRKTPSVTDAVRGAWDALWTPDDEAGLDGVRVQPWELLRSDTFFGGIFENSVKVDPFIALSVADRDALVPAAGADNAGRSVLDVTLAGKPKRSTSLRWTRAFSFRRSPALRTSFKMDGLAAEVDNSNRVHAASAADSAGHSLGRKRSGSEQHAQIFPQPQEDRRRLRRSATVGEVQRTLSRAWSQRKSGGREERDARAAQGLGVV